MEAISLEDLKEQISKQRRVIEGKRKAALSPLEKACGSYKAPLTGLGDDGPARFQPGMAKTDFAALENLVSLLVISLALRANEAAIKDNRQVDIPDAVIPPCQSHSPWILGYVS